MRKLSSTEFFELFDVMYDEDNKTVVFNMKDNDLVIKSKQFVLGSEGPMILNSKNRVYFNTGPLYSECFTMDEYNKIVEEAYLENIRKLQDMKPHNQDECPDCHLNEQKGP